MLTMTDPDARLVADVLAASDRPMTTDLLVSAANAYAALRSSRERADAMARRAAARAAHQQTTGETA
jgi:hypothetical protein